MAAKKLEQYKYFTPIALGLCALFATFVGMIALEASEAIEDLEESNLNQEVRFENINKQ